MENIFDALRITACELVEPKKKFLRRSKVLDMKLEIENVSPSTVRFCSMEYIALKSDGHLTHYVSKRGAVFSPEDKIDQDLYDHFSDSPRLVIEMPDGRKMSGILPHVSIKSGEKVEYLLKNIEKGSDMALMNFSAKEYSLERDGKASSPTIASRPVKSYIIPGKIDVLDQSRLVKRDISYGHCYLG